jgi:endonuclease YncB( thermonuclease family)
VQVTAAVDGDTLDVRAADGDERVRLLGVDAPELAHHGLPAGCGASEAHEALRGLEGRIVTLGFDRVCADAYGRTLAYAAVPREDLERAWPDAARVLPLVDRATGADEPEPDLSVALLAAGRVRRFDEAWVQPLRAERALLAAERLARARASGVWGDCP